MEERSINTPKNAAIRRKQAMQLAGLCLFLDNSKYIIDYHKAICQLENCSDEQFPLASYIKESVLDWYNNCHNEQLHPQAWVQKRLRDILFPAQQEPQVSFFHVRWAIRVYINAVKKLYSDRPAQESNSKIRLTRTDWARAERTIFSCFLCEWLRSNTGMRQGLYDFAARPFGTPREKSDKRDYAFFKYVHTEIKTLFEMRQIQAVDENSIVRPLKPAGKSKYSYSYAELCLLELAQKAGPDSRLRLLRSISRRKKMLMVQKEQTEISGISCEFSDYYKLLNEIEEYGKKAEQGDVLSCKRYVASSMAMEVLEASNRLYLAAAVTNYAAKHKWKKDYNLRNKNREIIETLWCRLPIADVMRFPRGVSCESRVQMHSELSWTYNIMNYEKDIAAIFEQEDSEAAIYAQKQCILRKEIDDALSMLLILFPLSTLPAWSDQNFSDVFKFYKEEYNVVAALKKYPLPTAADHQAVATNGRRRRKSILDRYRDNYLYLISMGGSGPERIYDIYKRAKENNH